MASRRYNKHPRLESGLVKFPKGVQNFSLTINSDRYIDANHSPVDFTYIVDEEGDYFRNGALNLSAGTTWETCLQRLDMPNNFISFPSLSADGNLNAAYIVLSFSITYEIETDKIKKKDRCALFFEP